MLGRVRVVLGSERDLSPLWKGFAIQPQSDEAEHHAEGYQRVGFFMDYLTPEALAHDVAVLLREPASSRRDAQGASGVPCVAS